MKKIIIIDNPLKNVIVSENIKVTKLSSITNDSEYFKLKRYSLTSTFYLENLEIPFIFYELIVKKSNLDVLDQFSEKIAKML